MLLAHIMELPAEELLIPLASGGGTVFLALRAWVHEKRK